ncbi:MAG: sigma-70 family RNA polymerase sigma factor [Clostridiales bacterium]|nr:sigma-70 family RNA polymerase sigma factor [Clostridiales bacterium]
MDNKGKTLEECFDAAIKKYGDMVYRIAMNQMKNGSDADDIFQEVFIKWLQHHDKFQSDEHEKAWLIRVTINQCKSILKSSWYSKTDEMKEELENTLVYTDTVQEEGSLSEAVNKLPEKYRIVIHLFYYEELSILQISQALNEKESTIRTQLTRARRKLKQLLKGVEFDV